MEVDDSDSEYEVEESVVLVELNGIIDANFLLQEQTPTKILGIDTDKPILQIGHYIFSGEYEHTMGTVVAYQPADSTKNASGTEYEYVCKTDKKLTMKRIFIKEKTKDNIAASEEVSCTTSILNGESNDSSIILNEIINTANNHIEDTHPNVAHTEIGNIKDDARSLSMTVEESQQMPFFSNTSVENDTSNEAQESSLNINDSKTTNPENTSTPDKSLSSKNKGCKRKKRAMKGKRQKEGAENANEDVDPVPYRKQMKVEASTPELQEIDESEMQEIDESEMQGMDESDMREKDEYDEQQKDEYVAQEKDESVELQKEECVVLEKDESKVHSKNKSDMKEKVEYGELQKDEYVVQEKDESEELQKEEYVVLEKDESKVHRKNESDRQEKYESDMQEMDKSDMQKKVESDEQQKEEYVVQEKDESEELQKEKYVVQEKDESKVHTKNKSHMQKKDISDIQEKGEPSMCGKDEYNIEEKEESDMQEKDGSSMLEKDESNVLEKDESNMLGKDECDVLEKNESDVHGKEELHLKEKCKSDVQKKDGKDQCIAQSENELITTSANEQSSESITNKENLFVSNEGTSQSKEDSVRIERGGISISNSHLSTDNTNEVPPQKKLKVVKELNIESDNDVPEEENIGFCVEASTIYLEENEASLISDSEIVNQLVESSTDKMLLSDNSTNANEIRNDGNCSSSGDMIATNKRSVPTDVCQSSDSKNISKILSESIEKCASTGASSSTNKKSKKGMHDQGYGSVSRSSPYSKSVQTDSLKHASCEVSQSLDDETETMSLYPEVKDSNECQTSVPLPSPRNTSPERDIDNADEGSNIVDVNISGEPRLFVEETEPAKRKLSSCEVTQSSNSETSEEVSECEVFSENPLPSIGDVFNRSAKEQLDPFGLAAGSSDEVEPSRSSLASESSTSEVSQSHKSVIMDSKSAEERNLEDLPFADVGECSQSSDQVNDNLNGTSMGNNKDLCVSSCDVTKDSTLQNESLEPDKNIRSAGCEVSQSDKSGASTSSHNIEIEELSSNECDAPSMDLEGNQSHSVDQYGMGTLHTAIDVIDTETTSQRQMTCEVSQSFSSTNTPSVSRMNLNTDNKFSSNECDNYANSFRSGVSSDDSNNCVSSDDVSHFPSPLVNVIEEQEKNPICEVSQSFRSGQNVVLPDEPCGSSDKSQRNSNTDKLKSKNSCEVSQSLELESSSVHELYEDEDEIINECERSNLSVDAVDQSDDNVEEICESSDDVIVPSNDESNSQPEQMRFINNSACEVSQSYRLEDGVLHALSEQFFVGVESSNECEMYGSSVSSAPEYNISRSDSEEKNICESSDDIERSSGDVKSSSQNSKSDSQEACQSTKSDDNFTCDTARVSENSSNEYDAGNEASNIIDDGTNVCESSVDLNINDGSPDFNSDACSSSDKLSKKANDIKQCDSFSNQEIAGPSSEASINVMEGNQITQSENEFTTDLVSSNSSQNNTVKVSSSVDSISSNYVDVIYSSSNVSNSTTFSSSEVSQSSTKKGPFVWSGNLLSVASSSNSNIGSIPDNVSSDGQFEPSFSSNINVPSSANNSILITDSKNSAVPSDSSMPSSRSNDMTESSISSSLASGIRIKKHILKKTNEMSFENFSSSQSTTVAKEQKRESVILSGNSYIKSSDNSSFQNQPQVDSQQLPFQHGNTSQIESNPDPNPRPSLLEVMVSSASDFRNSLLYDSNSFSKEINNSSVVESSSNNVRSSNEFPESFISDATGGLSEESGVATPTVIVPQSFLVENSDSSRIEVSGSLEGKGNKSSSESNRSQHQVSQSSDIVNTHSSSSQTKALASDDISESLRPDIVQSSSQALQALHIPTEAASNKTTRLETNNFIVSNSSKKAQVPESSSAHILVPTYNSNALVSSENSSQSIESSCDLPSSFNISGTVDGEVSSMPSIVDHSNPDVPLMDSSEQCSVIEGNLVLLSRPDTIFDRPEDNLTQVGVLSANSGFVSFQPGDQVIIHTADEADILNSQSFSTSTVELPLLEMASSVASTSQINTYGLETEGNVSTPPANEVQVVAIPQDGDRSSEVSESLSGGQKKQSQSILADNNVSCSVVEFSLTNETNDENYTFNREEFSGISREAESKSNEGISSFQSVSDESILPVQNLPSSDNAELSMYSHIGEFEDSIQSSSLDATHFSINEQIRAISSPPNFSNDEGSDEQIPSNINAFASFSTESHNLPSMQYGIPSISNIPTSFISGEISSRLHTVEFLDSKSAVSGIRGIDSISRNTVVQSPNYSQEHASIVGNEVSASESHGINEDIEESSQMSDLVVTENSPEEYEVLSEYEEIENVEEDSNFVDSSND